MRDRYNLNTLPFGVFDDTFDGTSLPFAAVSDLLSAFANAVVILTPALVAVGVRQAVYPSPLIDNI